MRSARLRTLCCPCVQIALKMSTLVAHNPMVSVCPLLGACTRSGIQPLRVHDRHSTVPAEVDPLARKTICFSKTTQMHDIVIGLFVNRYAFGRAV